MTMGLRPGKNHCSKGQYTFTFPETQRIFSDGGFSSATLKLQAEAPLKSQRTEPDTHRQQMRFLPEEMSGSISTWKQRREEKGTRETLLEAKLQSESEEKPKTREAGGVGQTGVPLPPSPRARHSSARRLLEHLHSWKHKGNQAGAKAPPKSRRRATDRRAEQCCVPVCILSLLAS